MSTIVKLDNVIKTYGQGDVAVQALKGVNLDLMEGAFAAVAGPSGSGKSTMLNLISGLDKPSDGEVRLDGELINNLSASKLSRLRMNKIGFVFQSYNLMPVLTAFENAEYVLMLQGVKPSVRKEKVMAMLKLVGLKGMEHRFPRQLSGGQQQRVAIARAIVAEPKLVLADEPTANVDSETGAALLDLMAKLNAEKKVTFLFSTHDPSVIKRAKQLIVLKDGDIAFNGSPDDRPKAA